MIGALIETGELAAAETACVAALARCQDVGDLDNQPILLASMADLDLRAGRIQDAAAHLREGLQAAVRTGDWFDVLAGLWYCGLLCSTTGATPKRSRCGPLKPSTSGTRDPRGHP